MIVRLGNLRDVDGTRLNESALAVSLIQALFALTFLAASQEEAASHHVNNGMPLRYERN